MRVRGPRVGIGEARRAAGVGRAPGTWAALSSEATVSVGASLPGEGLAHRPRPPSCSSCRLISHPQSALNAGLAPQAFHQLLELSHLITPVCHSSTADSSLIRCTHPPPVKPTAQAAGGPGGPPLPSCLPLRPRAQLTKAHYC